MKNERLHILQSSSQVTACKTVKAFEEYYALINRARGPYEEMFVLTFKAYEPNAVRSLHIECQDKHLPHGPKSRKSFIVYLHKQNLERALLYTYTNKIVHDEILKS